MQVPVPPVTGLRFHGVGAQLQRLTCTSVARTAKDAPVALNFNVTSTHSREILHTTGAHPGTRNDKTLARLDLFFTRMRMGALKTGDGHEVSKVSFELLTSDGEGCTDQGPYIITDNGYHHWPMLQFAPKYCSDKRWLRWAKRLESIRKDSECTYGILKQRFRELRLPSEFKKAITVEHVFKTCCQLHNMNQLQTVQEAGTPAARSARARRPTSGTAKKQQSQLPTSLVFFSANRGRRGANPAKRILATQPSRSSPTQL